MKCYYLQQQQQVCSDACLAWKVVQAVVAYDVVVRLPQPVKLLDKQVKRGRGPILGAPPINNITCCASSLREGTLRVDWGSELLTSARCAPR